VLLSTLGRVGLGVQVTTCTPIPPPQRITRDLMLVLGHSAASLVRGVVPNTSWVAFSACTNARSAADILIGQPGQLVVGAAERLGQPSMGGEHGAVGGGWPARPGGVHRQQVPASISPSRCTSLAT
jgi:hypothetical protein